MTRKEHKIKCLLSIYQNLRAASVKTSTHFDLEGLRKEIDGLTDKVVDMIKKEEETEDTEKYAWVIATADGMNVSCKKDEARVTVTYTDSSTYYDIEEEFYMNDFNDKEGLLEDIIKFIKDWDSEDEADARFGIEEYAYIDPIAEMNGYIDRFQKVRQNLQELIDKEKKC